jgi:copper chaperone CopZ
MFCVEDFGVRVHKIVLVIYIMYCNYCVVSTKQTLEKTEGAVIYVQSINMTFNNISVISWQSVLLVEETGVPGENHRHVASH